MGVQLQKSFKMRICAVQSILKKAKETGTVKDRPLSGRPSSTTP